MSEGSALQQAVRKAWRELEEEGEGKMLRLRLARISDDQIAVRAHFSEDDYPVEMVLNLGRVSKKHPAS